MEASGGRSLLRQHGVTGEQAQQGEELLVYSALAAVGVLWLLRRRWRRRR